MPKPLYYEQNAERFAKWAGQIIHVVAGVPEIPDPADQDKDRLRRQAWACEHAQRDAAWLAILKAGARDEDVGLITDADEIPSPPALAWEGPGAVSLWMRTTLYAVDWEVPPSYPLPPSAVAATVGFLREQGGRLGAVRDNRAAYPMITDGGWHFSWLGGPERQLAKLEQSTCHTELLEHPEAELIRSGARYRDGVSGGGIPVVPVEADQSWPVWIRERKAPAERFRPR